MHLPKGRVYPPQNTVESGKSLPSSAAAPAHSSGLTPWTDRRGERRRTADRPKTRLRDDPQGMGQAGPRQARDLSVNPPEWTVSGIVGLGI